MVSIANGILQPLSELLPSDLFPVDLFSLEDSKGSILDRIYVLDSDYDGVAGWIFIRRHDSIRR